MLTLILQCLLDARCAQFMPQRGKLEEIKSCLPSTKNNCSKKLVLLHSSRSTKPLLPKESNWRRGLNENCKKKFELENKLGLTVTPIIQINQSPGTKIFKKVTGKKTLVDPKSEEQTFPGIRTMPNLENRSNSVWVRKVDFPEWSTSPMRPDWAIFQSSPNIWKMVWAFKIKMLWLLFGTEYGLNKS